MLDKAVYAWYLLSEELPRPIHSNVPVAQKSENLKLYSDSTT